MTTATGPLDGPFMTSLHLTDYSGDPDFAIFLPDAQEGSGVVAGALARLGRTRDERKAA